MADKILYTRNSMNHDTALVDILERDGITFDSSDLPDSLKKIKSDHYPLILCDVFLELPADSRRLGPMDEELHSMISAGPRELYGNVALRFLRHLKQTSNMDAQFIALSYHDEVMHSVVRPELRRDIIVAGAADYVLMRSEDPDMDCYKRLVEKIQYHLKN